ncbi:ICE-like protease (caspase) p20 domain protein [Ceratobasidium sp. AG-Ba]|nr:ICE-like protease (caspase) p20 domain protein [Ceratobasidium sp. AG-Ba]
MSWNNQYPPPSGPPPGQFGFPSPSQYGPPPGPPPHSGYNPSYAPPSGPPPGQFGFPQPGGASNQPGYAPSYSPSYGPPPGPPPVPGNRPGGGYAPPSGPPPPVHRDSGSGYPGQSYHQNNNNNNGQGWQQNNPSYPGGAPIDWSRPNQNQGGALNSNAGDHAPAASWYNGPPGGQTGYGTGGPGHPGGTPAMGNAHMPPGGQQTYGPSQQGGGPQMSFQYSMCTGRKKALTIGINYFGQDGELRGCINDSNNIKAFLCRQFGYKNEDIVQLTDDAPNPRQKPTRENILAAMQWLVRDAKPDDSLFFHYSGHGGQTKDLDGDEADGQDEVIYPVDFEKNGHIVDDDMHAIMVRPLPPGCRLTAIFDSCHSGSALDLPYIYSTEGKIKEPNLLAEAGMGLLGAGLSYARGDMSGVVKGLGGLFKSATGSNKKAEDYARQTRTSPADVISWSGCKDSQTSADTVEAGEATGAMSYAFIEVLSQRPQQSYQELLNNIRDVLRSKYSQKPQLSSSHPMDTTVLFIA